MSPRNQLAARRKALGFSQESLANAIDVTTSAVSRWEQGIATPKARFRRPLADLLDLTPVELDRLLDLDGQQQLAALNGHVVPQWLGHYAALEQAASELRTFEPIVIPALLQTEAYATAVERAYHRPVTHDEVARRIELRLTRQQVLEREPDPLRLLCVIDEAVLLRAVGDQSTMVDQLEHLTVMATRPNIELRIAPLDRSLYGAAFGAFQLLTSPGAASPYIACTEDLASKRYHDASGEVEAYDAFFDHIFNLSLHPADSIDLISTNGKRFR